MAQPVMKVPSKERNNQMQGRTNSGPDRLRGPVGAAIKGGPGAVKSGGVNRPVKKP